MPDKILGFSFTRSNNSSKPSPNYTEGYVPQQLPSYEKATKQKKRTTSSSNNPHELTGQDYSDKFHEAGSDGE